MTTCKKIADGTYTVRVSGRRVTIALPNYMIELLTEDMLRDEAIRSAKAAVKSGEV